jgi:hypothetical protein
MSSRATTITSWASVGCALLSSLFIYLAITRREETWLAYYLGLPMIGFVLGIPGLFRRPVLCFIGLVANACILAGQFV